MPARCDLYAQLVKNAKLDSATRFVRMVTKVEVPCAGRNALMVTKMTVTFAENQKERVDGRLSVLENRRTLEFPAESTDSDEVLAIHQIVKKAWFKVGSCATHLAMIRTRKESAQCVGNSALLTKISAEPFVSAKTNNALTTSWNKRLTQWK